MVPAIVVASGSALMWYHGRESHPEGDPLERVLQGRATPLRALGGVALALAGVVALVARGVRVDQLPAALAALAMALAGAAVLVGPYVGRLTTQLRDEERARIRDQERNDMAAHLHDSVLQTLALMQRAAADPRRMVMLARRQERELRSWLYDAKVQRRGRLAERAGRGDRRRGRARPRHARRSGRGRRRRRHAQRSTPCCWRFARRRSTRPSTPRPTSSASTSRSSRTPSRPSSATRVSASRRPRSATTVVASPCRYAIASNVSAGGQPWSRLPGAGTEWELVVPR